MTIHDKLPDAITYLELNVLLNKTHQVWETIFFCTAADMQLDVLRVIKASYDDVCLILCYDSLNKEIKVHVIMNTNKFFFSKFE